MPRQTPPCPCERCPYDVGVCLGERWRADASPEGFALRFRCPYLDLALDAPGAGLGPWQVTDLTFGDPIASGEALCADQVVERAANALERAGWFRPHGRRTIAAAIADAYGLSDEAG